MSKERSQIIGMLVVANDQGAEYVVRILARELMDLLDFELQNNYQEGEDVNHLPASDWTSSEETQAETWNTYTDDELDNLLMDNKKLDWVRRFKEIILESFGVEVGLKEVKDIADQRFNDIHA